MKTFILSTLASLSLFAAPSFDDDMAIYETRETAFAYWNVGMFMLMPTAGVGYRVQNTTTGFDLNISAATVDVNSFYHIRGNALWLYYPKPDIRSQFYFGAGPGLHKIYLHLADEEHEEEYDIHLGALTPELVVGHEKSLESGMKRFYQIQVTPPVYIFDPLSRNRMATAGKIPLVEIQAGFNF